MSGDIYREVAARTFEISLEDVSPDQRQFVKTTLFPVMYSSSPLWDIDRMVEYVKGVLVTLSLLEKTHNTNQRDPNQ